MALGFALALAAVASVAGNNILVLIACTVLAWWLVGWAMAWQTVRQLHARRSLPVELFARREAAGHWVVRNDGPLPATEILITDGSALGSLPLLPGHGVREVGCGFRFPRRGLAHLGELKLVVETMGWFRGTATVARGADLMIYPEPLPGPHAQQQLGSSFGETDGVEKGGTGELLDLRPHQPGERLTRVHWPTVARTGRMLVAERAEDEQESTWIVLADRKGEAWEREISSAVATVLRAAREGSPVGLELPATLDQPQRRIQPGSGLAQRRTLLDVLGALPERP